MSGSTPSLGPCCICGGTRRVRNVIELDKKSPTAGRGWGCLVCGLPLDGAVAVVCDYCFEEHTKKSTVPHSLVFALKFACKGYPATDGRVSFKELVGSHEHNLQFHTEETV